MDETSALIQRMRSGEENAREVLIEKNMGLASSVARRFMGRGEDWEDLLQVAVIGLIKAIDRFDPDVGAAFSTYAVPIIMGEIRQFLREGSLIKVSRSIRENAMKLERSRRMLRESLGREPRLSELMEGTGLKREDVIMALEAGEGVLSLEGTAGDGEDGLPLMERIVKDGAGGQATLTQPREDAEKDHVLENLLVKQVLKELSKDDLRLIRMRFFQEKTQAETARMLGISQVQAGRREKKLLEKLRERFS